MGKVIVSLSITPDGFADAEHVMVDPEFFEFTHTLMNDAELVAFGRHTFDIFQSRWPQRLLDESSPDWVKKMAQSLHDINKIVFSSTLEKTTWHNSAIIKQLNVADIRSFKQNNTGDLVTFGSLSVIQALTAMNMVDDYYFNIVPLLAGKGEARLFDKVQLNAFAPLKYVDCKPLASGVLIAHYKNEKSE